MKPETPMQALSAGLSCGGVGLYGPWDPTQAENYAIADSFLKTQCHIFIHATYIV